MLQLLLLKQRRNAVKFDSSVHEIPTLNKSATICSSAGDRQGALARWGADGAQVVLPHIHYGCTGGCTFRPGKLRPTKNGTLSLLHTCSCWKSSAFVVYLPFSAFTLYQPSVSTDYRIHTFILISLYRSKTLVGFSSGSL